MTEQSTPVPPGGSATQAPASAWCLTAGLLIALALGIGIALVATTGAKSGLGLADLGPDMLRDALPLLIAAELLKFALATAILGAAWHLQWLIGTGAIRPLATSVAIIAALLILASGLIGLLSLRALFDGSAGVRYARLGPQLGLLSVPATGLWAIVVSARGRKHARFTSATLLAAIAIAVAGAMAIVVPPAAMLAALVGIYWWLTLARQLRRAR